MYTELIGNMALPVSGTAESLGSAAVIKRYAIGANISIRRFGFAIKTATVSSGNIVVKLKYYPVVGSSASEVVLSTLTIPTAIAAGKVYYANLDSVKLYPGQELVVEVTTASAGGGAAGDGYSLIEGYHNPDDPRNNSSMVLSA